MEHLTVMGDIIEKGYKFYLKKPTAETKKILDDLATYYQELSTKIDTHDYTIDDKHYWDIERIGLEIMPNRLSPIGL